MLFSWRTTATLWINISITYVKDRHIHAHTHTQTVKKYVNNNETFLFFSLQLLQDTYIHVYTHTHKIKWESMWCYVNDICFSCGLCNKMQKKKKTKKSDICERSHNMYAHFELRFIYFDFCTALLWIDDEEKCDEENVY